MGADTEYGWNEAMGLSLIAKMRSDLKASMLNRNNTVKDAIRVVMSEFPTKITVPITLESGKKSSRPKQEDEISNDDVIGVIQGLMKSEKQTLELKKENSSDYLRILETYLPRMADEEEIATWVRENIDFSQFKNVVQAMGPVMKHFGKNADGNVVKKILSAMAG
jgi:hypothetical protein